MNIDEIDKYLLEELSPEERKLFAKRAEQDDLLSKEVTLRRQELQLIEQYGRGALKSTLQGIHESEFGSKTSSSKLWKYLGVSALILGLAAAGYWLVGDTKSQPQTNKQLYASYYTPAAYDNTTRSATSDQSTALASAYNAKDFSSVVSLATLLDPEDKDRSAVRLIVGVSLLELSEVDKAAIQFQSIISSGDFNYVDQARWYLALTHLKADQKDLAKSTLLPLTTDADADYYEEATKLLQQL